MSHDAQHTHSNVIYYKIFGTLLVLTIVTVALNYLHMALALAIACALLVAVTKASLVASFFMHLIAEKKLIYLILGFTFFFFAGMMGLIVAANYSVPQGTEFLETKYAKPPATGHGHNVSEVQSHPPVGEEAHH